MSLSAGAKKGLGMIVIIGIVAGGGLWANKNGYLGGKDVVAKVMGKKIELSNAAPLSSITSVAQLPFPSDNVLGVGEEYRVEHPAWNAFLGFEFANGGPVTTKGSIMEQQGITNLKIIREDDFNKQVKDLVAYGGAWKQQGGNPRKGAQFISVMLDGSAAYLKAAKNGLAPYGLHPVIVASFGKSDGEDGFFGPKEWKEKPEKMKGKEVVFVLLDGDGNDPIKFATDNGVEINPDVTTHDPDKLNIIPAPDDNYLKAVDFFNNHTKVRKEIVRNGKKTGKFDEFEADAVATWTPGDMRAFKGRGGVIGIVTTKDYYWQMPEAFITIKEWADANPKAVKSIIKAGMLGGEQVKVHDKSLYRSCEIAAKIYQGTGEEKTAKYWYDNFRRHEITDSKGQKVMVGGSMNFSLADMPVVFGLDRGDGGPAQSSYTAFSDALAALWPEKLSDYPKWEEIFYDRFIKELVAEGGFNTDLAQKPTYNAAPIDKVLSSNSVDIVFVIGKSALTDTGRKQLKQLFNTINTTTQKVNLIGHTDPSGNPVSNKALSIARAVAARDYLVQLGLDPARFDQVTGVGSDQPSGKGPAYDRRVTYELGM
jgi:outer membrane protein OmpA-like peptidoglycan-associated protein